MLALKRAFDPRRPSQSRQGDPDAVALRRVRPHARQARPAPVRRAAALLSGRRSHVNEAVEALAERIRKAARGRREAASSAAAAPRTSTARPCPQAASRSTRARSAAGPSTSRAELVVTAPGGMTLADLETQLAAKGQCLAFEPPRFGPASTVGGMVAAGLAGPSRAVAGSVRDHVLGIALLNGSGELLRFGGRVIKNVAGYDVSRLVAGSLGILGVIVEVSLKVLPKAEAEATLRFDLQAAGGAAPPARMGRRSRCRSTRAPGGTATSSIACAARRRRCARPCVARRRADRAPAPPRRSGTACATTPIRSSSPPTTRSSTRTRRSGACRCRRPRRSSASPATS